MTKEDAGDRLFVENPDCYKLDLSMALTDQIFHLTHLDKSHLTGDALVNKAFEDVSGWLNGSVEVI